jgi:hypothetical protein
MAMYQLFTNAINDACQCPMVRKLAFKVFDVIDGKRTSINKSSDQMKVPLSGQQVVAMLYIACHGLVN